MGGGSTHPEDKFIIILFHTRLGSKASKISLVRFPWVCQSVKWAGGESLGCAEHDTITITPLKHSQAIQKHSLSTSSVTMRSAGSAGIVLNKNENTNCLLIQWIQLWLQTRREFELLQFEDLNKKITYKRRLGLWQLHYAVLY